MMVQKCPSLLKIYSLLHSQNLFKTPPLPSLYGPVAQPGSSAALIRQRSAVQIRSGPYIFFSFDRTNEKEELFRMLGNCGFRHFLCLTEGKAKEKVGAHPLRSIHPPFFVDIIFLIFPHGKINS